MKVKKIILPLFLVMIIALSTVMLFGCGTKTTSEDTYLQFDSVFTALKEDRDTFETKTVNSLTSDYSLKDVGPKYNTIRVNNHQQYIVLVDEGLNFIEKYYPVLKDCKIKINYKDLNDKVKALKNSYLKVKNEHEKMIEADGFNINSELYNGFFYNYRVAISNFITNIYNTANALGKFLYKNVNLAANIGNEKMTAEALEFYLDYQYLALYDDFRVFFMTSCKGITIADNYYTNIYNKMTVLNKLNSKEKNLEMTAETAKTLSSFFNSLSGTRADVVQAMKGFSCYDYIYSYGGSMISYKKAYENAEIYYNTIHDYFMGGEYISSFLNIINYITSLATK